MHLVIYHRVPGVSVWYKFSYFPNYHTFFKIYFSLSGGIDMVQVMVCTRMPKHTTEVVEVTNLLLLIERPKS